MGRVIQHLFYREGTLIGIGHSTVDGWLAKVHFAVGMEPDEVRTEEIEVEDNDPIYPWNKSESPHQDLIWS